MRALVALEPVEGMRVDETASKREREELLSAPRIRLTVPG
jgi:hypothetical protein